MVPPHRHGSRTGASYSPEAVGRLGGPHRQVVFVDHIHGQLVVARALNGSRAAGAGRRGLTPALAGPVLPHLYFPLLPLAGDACGRK